MLQVTALDPDKGINDLMIYSIEGSCKKRKKVTPCYSWEYMICFLPVFKDSTVDGLFKISENGGIISVASGIDREVTGDTVTLNVKVRNQEENNINCWSQFNIYKVNISRRSGECVNQGADMVIKEGCLFLT